MKQRLWLLNLTLLGLVIYAGMAFRDRWEQFRRREAALLSGSLKPEPTPALTPIPPVQPSTAGTYIEVAQKMMFVRDRNPVVILDPPPPPPPPKPMPAFPVAYGVIDLGDGPTAILSDKPGAQHRGYRPGDMIGEFKLLAMNNKEILFEWEGQKIHKLIEELQDKRAIALAAAQAVEAANNAATQAPPPPAANAPPPKPGPGTSLGNNTKACIPGDTSPAGTVVDGMRKVLTKTPFGESCRWETAK